MHWLLLTKTDLFFNLDKIRPKFYRDGQRTLNEQAPCLHARVGVKPSGSSGTLKLADSAVLGLHINAST